MGSMGLFSSKREKEDFLVKKTMLCSAISFDDDTSYVLSWA